MSVLEALRQESTDDVVRTELVGYVRDPERRRQARETMAAFGISLDAVARAIAFAIDQPPDVEIGDITIRPTRQG
ncbi:hypothetical protein [Mycobacterium shigaense]|uniref:Oxidoreductase n=1 Tax=Mycobacterium shigaense TaxID=722731 RepID=A0A1Z4EIX7_9MYCO|nr:hypothetical protein [Mycobacterium shigaense]PRI13778.1 hypothetical protein B2J96_19215 [Mycobacterium shigaense]BAX92918.1 oxidoreductase [Mycobacterium shigaense]